jgi:hypothetical protein
MGNDEYTIMTFFVIPAVLMAHAVIFAGNYTIKDAGKIAAAWFLGWFIKPFSGLPAFFGSIGSLMFGDRPALKKVIIGVLVTLPLLCIIIPLLSGADQMFGYHVENILSDWNVPSFIWHTFVTILVFALLYSFLWNVGFGKNELAAGVTPLKIDPIISAIVLGTVSFLYLLFLGIQFTYLFGIAGLPSGMTYSHYAREGFAQTVVVCAINLAIFGFFLGFGVKCKAVKGLLSGLLALTGIMLISGSIRLGLYIDAYGLTWLRLFSGWFIIYLVVVIILCIVRLVREKLPIVAICAMILLGWYVVLGYVNPDVLINAYNLNLGYDLVVLN